MFPRNFYFAGDVAAAHASDPNARCGSCGAESTRSVITTRVEGSESSDRHRRASIIDRDRGLHPDTWTTVMHRENGDPPIGRADAPRNHGLRDRAIVTIHLT